MQIAANKRSRMSVGESAERQNAKNNRASITNESEKIHHFVDDTGQDSISFNASNSRTRPVEGERKMTMKFRSKRNEYAKLQQINEKVQDSAKSD